MSRKNINIFLKEKMERTEREKMRIVGVTLNEVANDCGLAISDVCRLLNDDLVASVKTSANKLICEKAKMIETETRESAHAES